MSAGGQCDAGAEPLSDSEEAISINLIADGQGVQIVNASGERCSDGVARVVGVAGERVEQDAGSARAFELCGPRRERLGCAGKLGFFGPRGSCVRSFGYGHGVASQEQNVVAQDGESGETLSPSDLSKCKPAVRRGCAFFERICAIGFDQWRTPNQPRKTRKTLRCTVVHGDSAGDAR